MYKHMAIKHTCCTTLSTIPWNLYSCLIQNKKLTPPFFLDFVLRVPNKSRNTVPGRVGLDKKTKNLKNNILP